MAKDMKGGYGEKLPTLPKEKAKVVKPNDKVRQSVEKLSKSKGMG
jgi:hypothetical protein